ncbi:hypothetical protein IBX65_06620 [Candidatus Aerophobetes bacterium]|nr:hypothetical protein [Candidatus Aerophobetes bacterium]
MRFKIVKLFFEILIFIILGLVLIKGMDFSLIPRTNLKEHFYSRGVQETGAINLVSSIYLSYRAFDTLGETIVLLLAVSGIIAIFKVKK